MSVHNEYAKYNFESIIDNITNTCNGVLRFKGAEPTKESVESEGYQDPWSKVVDLHPSELGIGVGHVFKFEDSAGRRGMVLATVVGNIVLDQRIPGHNIIRISAPSILRTMFGLGTVGLHQFKILFGESLGKGNRHVMDTRINNLVRAVESRKEHLKEVNPQKELL